MGLGKLNRKLIAISASLSTARSEAIETVREVENVRRVTQSFREVLAETKATKRGEAIDYLLGNAATSGLMETYLLLLSINPNHPDISKCKQALRDWSNVDESTFTFLERAFKDARRAKDRNRRDRGKALENDEIQQILNDVRGL